MHNGVYGVGNILLQFSKDTLGMGKTCLDASLWIWLPMPLRFRVSLFCLFLKVQVHDVVDKPQQAMAVLSG
jgi:hypothetical protein